MVSSPLSKNILTICTNICFCAPYSSPLVYTCVFISLPYYFDYCSFVISFKVRKFGSSNFVLFQIDLTIWGLLTSHMNFMINFCISTKKSHWDLIEIALYLCITLSDTVLNLPIHENGISFCLLTSSLIL